LLWSGSAIIDDIVFVNAFVSPVTTIVDILLVENVIGLRWSCRWRCGSAAWSAIV
jgi:hypothetical protein